MTKLLKAITQLFITLVWFIYVVLVRTPLGVFNRIPEGLKRNYINRAVPEDYREEVEKLANHEENRRFLIDGENFAKLIVGLMLTKTATTDETCIYSKCLGPEFYCGILRSLKSRTRIILEDPEGIEVIKALPQDIQSLIDFCVTDSPYGEYFISTKSAFWFAAPPNNNELSAICNFNEPETIQVLRERFEKLWKSSVPCS